MQLQDLKNIFQLGLGKLRTAVISKVGAISSKVDSIEREVLSLQGIGTSLRSNMQHLLDSHQDLENQIKHRMVSRDQFRLANNEIERQKARVDEINQRLQAKDDEMIQLDRAFQVICIQGRRRFRHPSIRT